MRALAVVEQRSHLVLGQHVHPLVRHLGWRHSLHRMVIRFALVDHEREETVQRAMAVVERRGGSPLLCEVDEEALDV